MPDVHDPLDGVTVRDTDEQLASIEAAERNESHVIDALAGTGKTRQIIRIAQRLLRRKPDRRVLILQFSRSAREMLEGRVAQAGFTEKQVKVSTAHALAWPTFGKKLERRVSADGELATITALADSPVLTRFAPSDPVAFATSVVDTLARYCSSAQRAIGIEHLPKGNANEVDAEAILEAANLVWEDFAEPSHALPIWHDVYLKLYALSEPTLKYTDLMFDEANDASPVMFGIYMRQKNPGVKIFVGDENQQIYAWRGAIDALKLLDLPRYPLTQSFRFGPNIADYANRILDRKGTKLRLRGVAEDPGRVVATSSEAPNVILARTNLGMFEAAIDLVHKGVGVAMSGSLRPQLKMLNAVYELYCGRNPADMPALAAFRTWTALVTASKSEQGSRLAPYVRLVEKHQRDIPKIGAKLIDNAKAPSKGGVRLSTTHGLKGDSDEVVRLWPDFDSFVEKSGEINHEEANLWYVAMTRPQRVLDLGGMAPLATQILGEPKIITLKTEPRAVFVEARAADGGPVAPELPLAPAASPSAAAAPQAAPPAAEAPPAAAARPPIVMVDATRDAPPKPRPAARVLDGEDRLSAELAALAPAPTAARAPAAAPPAAERSAPAVRPPDPPLRPASTALAPASTGRRSVPKPPRIVGLPTSITVESHEAYRVARLGAQRSPIGWLVPGGADLNQFERWLQPDVAVPSGDALPTVLAEPSAEPRHLVGSEPTVAALLGREVWNEILAAANQRAQGLCERCKASPSTQPHVRFDLAGIMARIVRVELLCERCHRLSHIERYSDDVLLTDLMTANNEALPFARARLARARKEQLRIDRRWYLILAPERVAAQAEVARAKASDVPMRTRLLRMVGRIAFS